MASLPARNPSRLADVEPSPVVLRVGTPGDAEQIALLIERDNHRAADRDEIRRLLGTAPRSVAHEGEELVGFAYARRFSPDIVELRNVLVANTRHRQCIGRRLFEHVEAQACAPAIGG